MNDRSQVLGFRIVTLVGPIAALGAFQFMFTEPSSARANEASVEFLSLPTVPDYQSAVETGNIDQNEVSSPFWYEEIELSLPVMPLIARPDDGIGETDPVFILSSVLPSSRKSFAVINGKARTIGDEIEPGWNLIKISGKDRYIILKHTSGRRLRVLIKQN